MPNELLHPRLSEEAKVFRDELDTLIRNSKGNIRIIAHFNPDGDAIYSALGLQQIMRNRYGILNKDVSVLIDDSKTSDFDALYETGDITWIHDEQNKDPLDYCDANDVLVFVDAGVVNRLIRDDKAPLRLTQEFKNIAIIDHHEYSQADRFEQIGLRDEKAHATSELVARLFDDTNDIDQIAARLLMIGIYSDSIGYRTFTASRSDTHYIVGNLLARANATEGELWQVLNIRPEIYQKYVQIMVANQVFGETDFGLKYSGTHYPDVVSGIIDSYNMRRAYRFFLEDICGNIQGQDLRWVVYPIGADAFHISFRSDGPYDINLLCRDGETFNFLNNRPGGGHKHSGGCDIILTRKDQDVIQHMSAGDAMSYVNELIKNKVIEHFKKKQQV